MLRDKRTLALLFVAPLFMMSLMYFLFDTGKTTYKIAAVNMDKTTEQILTENDITVMEYEKITDKTIVKNNLDGCLVIKNGKLVLRLQNGDPTKAKTLKIKVTQALSSRFRSVQNGNPSMAPAPEIRTEYIFGSGKTTFFDVFSTILIGFFVFFFVFLISGIGLLRERTTGTLQRLVSTPIKRSEIIAGYLAGYGIFAVIQTVIVVLFSVHVLHIILAGSIWYVLLINLLLAFAALSLGILLSAFASSEFQMLQFIPVIIVPQIFFTGILPVENMPLWLQTLAKIMPLYYGAHALKCVMYKGQGIEYFIRDILALVLFAIIFIVLNIFALKKYRKL